MNAENDLKSETLKSESVAEPRLDGRIAKHSLVIAGHRTSISLEAAFWEALKSLAAARGVSVPTLVEEIDSKRGGANLCSALRVHLLQAAQKQASPEPNNSVSTGG
jgi:predicted DNA-binding ribbon-helix-helix protein